MAVRKKSRQSQGFRGREIPKRLNIIRGEICVHVQSVKKRSNEENEKRNLKTEEG